MSAVEKRKEDNDKKKLSYWLKFLIEAGVSPDRAVTYTVNFVENHIEENMIADLTKDYLKEMGIKALGDIIAILKHSETKLKKTETNLTNLSAAAADIQATTSAEANSYRSHTPSPVEETKKSRTKRTPATSSISTLREYSPSSVRRKTSPEIIRRKASNPTSMRVRDADSPVRSRGRDSFSPEEVGSKADSPLQIKMKTDSPIRWKSKRESHERQASPTVIHRTVKPSRHGRREMSPITIHTSTKSHKREKIKPPEDSDDRSVLSQREEVPVQKKRRVLPEHEGKYKIIMPVGTSQKTAKLLSEGKISSTTTTVQTPTRSSRPSRIFSRLGSSRAHVESDEDLREDNSEWAAGDNSRLKDDVEFTIKLGDYRLTDEELSDINKHYADSGDESPKSYDVEDPDAAPYVGVLKNSERKSKQSTNPHISELKSRLGKSSNTPSRSNVKNRLGDNTVSSTTDIKPSRRTSEKFSPFSVTARLGAKPCTISKSPQSPVVKGIKAEAETNSVFRRLGK